MTRPFGVIICSRNPPSAVARLAARIEQEVPQARIAGILYERPRADDCSAGTPRPARRFLRWVSSLREALLRFLHACPARPNGASEFTLQDLTRACATRGWPLLAVDRQDSPEAVEFVKAQRPDFGIVYGSCAGLEPLANLPRHGLVGLYSEPDGAPREIILAARPLQGAGKPGSILQFAAIPLEPFDTSTSSALKANLVGNDLLVRAVADLALRTRKKRGASPAPPLPTPLLPSLVQDSPSAAQAPAACPTRRGRPAWKLLLRTLLFFPYVLVRNWVRRLRGSFPVTILYHHLVTDSPHPLGIPTEVFFRQVEFLRKHYKIASLDEAIKTLQRGRVTSPTVVLTFDDGYQTNLLGLRAVAEATGIPVAFFVCPEHATTQREFGHDLRRRQRPFPPLTWEQIAYLSASGFEIGSHTRSHFDCGSSDLEALQSEIAGSKADLEERLSRPVRYFSFPWGHPANMSTLAVELARRQYPYVFSACGGVNFPSRNGSLWHLRRCAHPNNLWELELTLQSLLDW